MDTKPPAATRVLVAIPAYNEEATITAVVQRVRDSLPEFELLVVNDGSRDTTERVLQRLNVKTATHLCNLGYGRAIQTAIKYALACDYEVLITLDADGQHQPEQIKDMFRESMAKGWDVLIGSRHVKERNYAHSPFGRRLGMQLFSTLVGVLAGQRIYDTSSGLKVLRRSVFEPLTRWHFVDFHAEAIVYLLQLGYRVGEFPVTMAERKHGQSMHSFQSYFKYPLKTSLMVLLGIVEANLTRRKKEP
jgi:glycosyltransferase involved in cell wall biosynthesis